MCLFLINKKEKEIQRKENIRSRKIDKRTRKMFSPHAHHNTNLRMIIYRWLEIYINLV